MADYQVNKFAYGLSARMATRSRHVCIFLGAGASRACGLPDISDLQQRILDGLEGDQKNAFDSQLEGRNLEHALSRLRRIGGLLDNDIDQVDGLTRLQADELDRKVCGLIVAALDISGADLSPMLRFSAWAARADYHLPVELFSVNYDLLLETALESLGVPYFDGFVGSLRAHFRTELVESVAGETDNWLPSFLVRLWKLHGSVNWAWEYGARREVVRLGMPVSETEPAAIYPSDAKYDESRRVPFVVLQDRLRRALHHPETLMLISGYSFGDAHINEILFDAARRRPRSELIAFCFDEIPIELAERAAVTPNLQVAAKTEAIIGGVRTRWESPEDALPDLWVNEGFALGDFKHLSAFLARSSPRRDELESRLSEALSNSSGENVA